jgi:subtilase family serine protease
MIRQFARYSRSSLTGMHILALVDSGNQVVESDEENNKASFRVP